MTSSINLPCEPLNFKEHKNDIYCGLLIDNEDPCHWKLPEMYNVKSLSVGEQETIVVFRERIYLVMTIYINHQEPSCCIFMFYPPLTWDRSPSVEYEA
jgi:hypothetical protein